ncbi:MAG: hypothetical protein HOP34_14750 [Methylococcaceae bacterium]|nr:hypothetical protein [Methylococcaceae bacterium]
MAHPICLKIGIVLLALSPLCFSETAVMSTHTATILNTIDHRRSQLTPADHRIASGLIAEADRAYQRQDYQQANQSYDLAIAYSWDAYAYIMAGDSHWRAVVNAGINDAPNKRPCSIRNQYFPHDTDQHLAQTYEVGFALAVKNPSCLAKLQAEAYQNAVKSDQCLRKLAGFYKTQAEDACVDAKQIQACLGKPFMLQGLK